MAPERVPLGLEDAAAEVHLDVLVASVDVRATGRTVITSPVKVGTLRSEASNTLLSESCQGVQSGRGSGSWAGGHC